MPKPVIPIWIPNLVLVCHIACQTPLIAPQKVTYWNQRHNFLIYCKKTGEIRNNSVIRRNLLDSIKTTVLYYRTTGTDWQSQSLIPLPLEKKLNGTLAPLSLILADNYYAFFLWIFFWDKCFYPGRRVWFLKMSLSITFHCSLILLLDQ